MSDDHGNGPRGALSPDDPSSRTFSPARQTPPPTAPGGYGTAVRYLRLGGLFVVVLLIVAAVIQVYYQRIPSKQDLLEQAKLGDRLRIGVAGDAPGISLRDSTTGQVQGFDIDIAYLIAGDLGYQPREVELLEIESEDRARMQTRDHDGNWVELDLVISTYSITEEREKNEGARFSAPYLETEQSVLTRRDHSPVPALTSLRGERVCVPTTTTSQPRALTAGLTIEGQLRTGDCVAGLLAGRYDAVTTDAAILAGFVAQQPDRLRLHDIGESTPERWAVNVRNEALRKLVNLSLYYSACDPNDQRWERAFDRHLRPLQAVSDNQQVAQSRQPDVTRPAVREWPWERRRCDDAAT